MIILFFYKHVCSFYLDSNMWFEMHGKYRTINKEYLSLFFYAKNIKISKKQLDVTQYSEKLFFVNVRFKEKQEYIRFIDTFEKKLEPFPPWVVFPELFNGAPRWNQGVEEDYCCNHWLKYWKKLSFVQQEEHKKKFNCPAEWSVWLAENNSYL